jgi:hypothetical protein
MQKIPDNKGDTKQDIDRSMKASGADVLIKKMVAHIKGKKK